MRIWDLPVDILCRAHLLGEHRELHAIWTYLTTSKGGSYRNHPETLRWKGKLPALLDRHEQIVVEFQRRGWKHHTPLTLPAAARRQRRIQDRFVNTREEQIELLKEKGCSCALLEYQRRSQSGR